jgi:hypothetical protein
MNRRFCYGVREGGSYSPSLLVWATDARSAMYIARQTGANVTGAREVVAWYAWDATFCEPDKRKSSPSYEPVIYGGGEGFYHRHRGKTYRMDERGTFLGCSQINPNP